MVEFALTVVVLFTLLFAIIDLSLMLYVNLTMQHAVREGARYAVVGQPDTDPKKGDVRRVAMERKISDSSNGLYIAKNIKEGPTVSVLTSRFNNYTTNQVKDTGAPNDIIVVSLTYAWPLMTPLLYPFFTDGNYTFTVRSTMKNEPWGQ